jgi:pimeloyl-ACP methyl ester carboxylesterase
LDANGSELEGSISTIEKVEVGGIQQGLIIRGEDITKPVLLFLHGGPGTPEFAVLQESDLNLEKNFVVVYWDQRGAGLSYASDIPAATMNVDQLIEDTKELSEILKTRFDEEKLFLMGHSWGGDLSLPIQRMLLLVMKRISLMIVLINY